MLIFLHVDEILHVDEFLQVDRLNKLKLFWIEVISN